MSLEPNLSHLSTVPSSTVDAKRMTSIDVPEDLVARPSFKSMFLVS